ncbi:MAG: NAD(P)-binding protein, partial [Acidobacteriota bacterium]
MDTLIIGAGPAGLAVAGRLRAAGASFDILEQSARVGNAWHEHYDRLCLHTVKEHSHLPGLPFP